MTSVSCCCVEHHQCTWPICLMALRIRWQPPAIAFCPPTQRLRVTLDVDVIWMSSNSSIVMAIISVNCTGNCSRLELWLIFLRLICIIFPSDHYFGLLQWGIGCSPLYFSLFFFKYFMPHCSVFQFSAAKVLRSFLPSSFSLALFVFSTHCNTATAICSSLFLIGCYSGLLSFSVSVLAKSSER